MAGKLIVNKREQVETTPEILEKLSGISFEWYKELSYFDESVEFTYNGRKFNSIMRAMVYNVVDDNKKADVDNMEKNQLFHHVSINNMKGNLLYEIIIAKYSQHELYI